MTKDLFIVVLASLTLMSGIALVMMILRRRRERAEAEERESELRFEREERERELDALQLRDEASKRSRRPIDDYAVPIELDGADE